MENLKLFENLPVTDEAKKRARDTHFQDTLIYWRNQRKLTLVQISDLAKIPYTTLFDWDNGDVTNPRMRGEIQRLADVLRVNVSVFFRKEI